MHVFAIPGLLLIFLAIHLWLVIKKGVSAPPAPGEPVDPKTYDAEYQKELKAGVPFLGEAMRKDILFSALAVIVVVVLAALVGPKGPSAPPDPTLGGANPRPEWPFLWLFALLVPQSRRRGDVYHPGVPTALDRCLVPRPAGVQSWRTRDPAAARWPFSP